MSAFSLTKFSSKTTGIALVAAVIVFLFYVGSIFQPLSRCSAPTNTKPRSWYKTEPSNQIIDQSSENATCFRFKFDPATDTLALLHIQKTGGTDFASKLLTLNVSEANRCFHWSGVSASEILAQNRQPTTRGPKIGNNGNIQENRALAPASFSCSRSLGSRKQKSWSDPESLVSVRSQWLLSRLTSGWPCGTHPSLARLTSCFLNWIKDQEGSPKASNFAADSANILNFIQQFQDPAQIPHPTRASARSPVVPKGHVYFVTILRDPVDRFLSEFLQTITGWGSRPDGLSEKLISLNRALVPSDYYCNGTLPEPTPSCRILIDKDKSLSRGSLLSKLALEERSASRRQRVGTSSRTLGYTKFPDHGQHQPTHTESLDPILLSEFLFCSSNMAVNRQSRMLAILPCINNQKQTGEETTVEEDATIFESAKRSLQSLPFFGLLEYPRQSAQLFEWTFGLKYEERMTDPPGHTSSSGAARLRSLLSRRQVKVIEQVNSLDVQFYRFAKQLFRERLELCRTCLPL